jgi:methionyl-tRNA formyltransferase
MPTSHSAAPAPRKIRVAVFGSFYRGYFVLHELLHGALADTVEVVGVATDDPAERFVSPHKRVWQYPHTEAEQTMVERLAARHGLKAYKGRVKTPEFYALCEEQWRPELCIMATFGQRIDSRLFDYPRLGFFNLHPCIEDGWPSRYAGSNPFQALLDTGRDHAVIALHRVNDGFDTGDLIAYSEHIPIPPGVGVVDLHKITGPTAGRFAAAEIGKILRSFA